jgi:hypothetical protein
LPAAVVKRILLSAILISIVWACVIVPATAGGALNEAAGQAGPRVKLSVGAANL